MRMLSHDTLTRLDQLYTQVYRDNYGILMAFHRDQLPVPQELQVAAEISLSNRCIIALRALDREISNRKMLFSHLAELEAIATESNQLHCHLQLPEAKPTLEKLILRSLWQLIFDANSDTLEGDVRYIERLIKLGNQLNLNLSLARCQELYFSCLQTRLIPQCQLAMQGEVKTNWNISQLRQLLQLGENLAVDVSLWLHQLP
ncbi:MAG: glycoside hydrolase, partial [Coleofasciculaceae cyanobacterium]